MILEVKNLCKNYGKKQTLVKAINDVSFKVDEGEFIAIVGPSGSGKSSLLHIEENITLPILLDRKKVDKKYLDELIEVLGLKNRINHLPNELSGGEQQRVSIARALMAKPDVILADEPTGNLDSKNSLEIIKLLKLCNKKYNQTIIMITHDDKLAKMASRIITMKDGQIISDEVNHESVK